VITFIVFCADKLYDTCCGLLMIFRLQVSRNVW